MPVLHCDLVGLAFPFCSKLTAMKRVPLARLVGWWLLLCLLGPVSGLGATMEEAVGEAASILTDSKLPPQAEIVIEVVNLHSKKRDLTAKAIETQLYQALSKKLKDFKLLFLEDSLTGVNLNQAIFIRGTYEPKGKTVTAVFAAMVGIRGEALAQAQVTFDTPKTVQEALVAVLDLEAPEMNPNQRRAYSEIFRSRLSERGKMQMASSAEVAKMSPDAIQESYKCSRDECATIIGEQLGVDRVISTSLIALGDDKFVLSAKIMDIKNGSILSSKTLEHNGGLSSLSDSLKLLADQLVEGSAPEQKELAPPEAVAAGSGLGAWVWHGAALGTLGISLGLSSSAASQYDSLTADNKTLESQYKLATTQAELTSIEEEYASNQAKMKTLKTQGSQYNALALVAGLWESYLFFFAGEAEVASVRQPGWHLAMVPEPAAGRSARLSLSYNW